MPESSSPLFISMAASVMSRPSCKIAFSDQPSGRDAVSRDGPYAFVAVKVQSSRTRPLSGIDGPPPGGGGGKPTPGSGDVSMSTTLAASRNRSRGPSGAPPVSVVTRPENDQPDDVFSTISVTSAPSTVIGS